MTKESLLKQAKLWGFKCEFDSYGKSIILPQNPQERWKLRIDNEERWLLVVGNVPQMFCTSLEVKFFLERRYNRLTLKIKAQNIINY
ncbi:hypothetical protein [Nostoc sp. FACHB-110]|uniref:hypothetical protein n=1 Tax=Nostoc sp. FACHB-110 TaxID=2692834 RepID=UPI00168252F1|nr:hypothetical protein [Nostoc sp. FACHB-110]MBD2439770.1 hypothetical protein [Nostoc sp. FACHB-110]